MNKDLLGGEDAAWLHMDEPTNPMVVTGVLELAERLPDDRARALLERMAAVPHFRARVVEPALRIGRPAWQEAADFDVSQHVERVELTSGSDAELHAFIGRAVSGTLDRHHPLWHVYLVDRPGSGTTILSRVHHCVGDGFALLGVLLSLCDEVATAPSTPTTPHATSEAMRGSARALKRMVMLPPDPKTLLKGTLGMAKRVAWSDPFSLEDVKKAAHIVKATVNDVLVAMAAGALGRYLARRGESTSGLEIHAMVPVNLRAPGEPLTLGNRFGLVLLGMPMGMGDPLARVAAVNDRMKRIKGTPEAVVGHILLRVMGWVPRPIEELGVGFFAKKTSLVLTNVPGPRSKLRLAGIPVSRIMFWVPQSGRMGLGMSIFSYAGEVTMGVLTDASLVPDPESIITELHAELAALLTSVRGEPHLPSDTARA